MRSKLFFVFIIFLISTKCYAELSDEQIHGLTYLVIQAESFGDRFTIGPSGERGLMQIQKKVWLSISQYPWSDAFNPVKNVKVGMGLLEMINEQYGKQATAARIIYTYNTGKWCFSKHLPRWTQHHPNKIYRKVLTDGDNT